MAVIHARAHTDLSLQYLSSDRAHESFVWKSKLVAYIDVYVLRINEVVVSAKPSLYVYIFQMYMWLLEIAQMFNAK